MRKGENKGMLERQKMKGRWKIELKENGRVVTVLNLNNMLTNLYAEAIAQHLTGQNTSEDNLRILYFAVGTGADSPQPTDTQLQAEIYRDIPISRSTSMTLSGAECQTMFVIPTNECNDVTLKEIGIFIGQATSEPNTGTLMSRMSIDIKKTSSMELVLTRYDEIDVR